MNPVPSPRAAIPRRQPLRPAGRSTLASLALGVLAAGLLAACAAAPRPAPPPAAPPAPAVEPVAPVPGAGASAGGRRGPVTGGLLGPLAGGSLGHYQDSLEKGGAETAAEYGADPAKEGFVVVDSVRVNPASVSPGETVNVIVTYAVLPTAKEGQATVKETREIRSGETLAANPAVTAVRGTGVWRSTLPVILPAGTPPGNYRVNAVVEMEGSRDSKETFFKVAP